MKNLSQPCPIPLNLSPLKNCNDLPNKYNLITAIATSTMPGNTNSSSTTTGLKLNADDVFM